MQQNLCECRQFRQLKAFYGGLDGAPIFGSLFGHLDETPRFRSLDGAPTFGSLFGHLDGVPTFGSLFGCLDGVPTFGSLFGHLDGAPTFGWVELHLKYLRGWLSILALRMAHFTLPS